MRIRDAPEGKSAPRPEPEPPAMFGRGHGRIWPDSPASKTAGATARGFKAGGLNIVLFTGTV